MDTEINNTSFTITHKKREKRNKYKSKKTCTELTFRNFKMLMKERKDLNKSRDSVHGLEDFTERKKVNYPKFIYKFNVIYVKIPGVHFVNID